MMALLGYEGFDECEPNNGSTLFTQDDMEVYMPFDKTGGNAQWNWTAVTGQAIGKAPGLLGGYGIRTINFTGNPRVVFFTNYTTFICGFRYKTRSGNVGNDDVIYLVDNKVSGTTLGAVGTVQCRLRTNSVSGKLEFTRGDSSQTILGTGTTVLVPDSWYFFEVKLTVGSGSSGSFTVRIAGAGTEITASGVNTQTSANAWVNLMSFLPTYNVDIILDDLYACDTTGPAPYNDFLGAIRIETLYPTNVVSAQWTPISPSELLRPIDTQTPTFSANQLYLIPWTPTGGGVLTKIQAQWHTSFTGNIKAAIYDRSGPGGEPGNLIASTTAVTNPTGNPSQPSAAFYDLTFSSPPTVTANTTYWIAWLADTNNVPWASSGASGFSYATTYAGGFPASLTPGSLVAQGNCYNTNIFFNGMNAIEVQEPNMDRDLTTNSETGAGIDLFGHDLLSSNPLVIFDVSVMSAAVKTDVLDLNYRNKLVSGATTSNGTRSDLATNFVRVRDSYATDPDTGLPWTGSGVDATDIGYERY